MGIVCAELGMCTDWAWEVLEGVDVGELNEDDDVCDLIWCKLALGESVENICRVEFPNHFAPVNISRGKQVAVSVGGSWAGNVLGKSDWVIPMKKVEKRNTITASIDKYSSLVSFSLSQLGIKHKRQPSLVNGVYTVTAVVGKDVVVDVVGPGDVVVGSEKYTGTRVLKGIHLAQSGYRVVNIEMKDVQRQLESNSLTPWIADLMASYNEKAKERVELKKVKSDDIVDDLLLG